MFELIPFERRGRSLAAFDPFRELAEFERRFWGNTPSVGSFRTDVTDTGEGYRLEAELPGFKREDIKIDLENERLTISAERSSESSSEDNPNYIKRERYYGAYSRSFDVTGIDTDGITASYNDGILTLDMPKKVKPVPASRRIELQ